nr:hypothetical protein Ade03nite_20610 [Actinoplanes derwentensis]
MAPEDLIARGDSGSPRPPARTPADHERSQANSGGNGSTKITGEASGVGDGNERYLSGQFFRDGVAAGFTGAGVAVTAGLLTGDTVGSPTGEAVGFPAGDAVGLPPGDAVGSLTGEAVGFPTGEAMGLAVVSTGETSGAAVSCFEIGEGFGAGVDSPANATADTPPIASTDAVPKASARPRVEKRIGTLLLVGDRFAGVDA